MGVLKPAFNSITRLHSRAATLRRLGTTTTVYETAIRITPSNYFRFIDGPSATVIRGREFIIPIDSMLGWPTETIVFGNDDDGFPTGGTYKLGNAAGDTVDLDFDSDATVIEAAIQDILGYEDATVSGDYLNGLSITFINVVAPLLLNMTDNQLTDGGNFASQYPTALYVPWTPIIKRADKIIDTTLGHMAIDEIVEVVDLGGDIMGYRIRCE